MQNESMNDDSKPDESSPPSPATSTAAVLEGAVKEFIARQAQKYGTKFSKRTISKSFLGNGLEASTLSRWTNPGKYRNWMIPTFRIPEVARVLVDESQQPAREREQLIADLMSARIAEIADDPKNEAVVVATWLAGVLEPSPDEAALLGVFRRVTADYPHQVFDSKDSVAEFEAFFRTKMDALWKDFFEERSLVAQQEVKAGHSGASGGATTTKAPKPKPKLDPAIVAAREQREFEYNARYHAILAIRDVQSKLGIKPVRKIPKKP